MTVRRAGFEDISEVLALYQELVGAAPIGERGSVKAVLLHPGTEIWCVQAGERLVAMATLHVLPNVTQSARPYCVVENVVVSKDARNCGYGRQIMEAVIAAAWRAEAYKIMLMTGQTAEASGFYEKLGFASDEKWAMTMRRAPLRTP